MTDTTGSANPAPQSLPLRDRGAGIALPAGVEQPHEAPARPPLTNPNGPPVLVKLTPPFSVRMCQFLWILSFAVGGFTTVYYFVIRKDLLPLISDVARAVTPGRAEETYDSTADIVFWVVFAIVVATLLVQITLLVSFMSRRPQIRWWQLLTLGIQVMLVVLSPEWVALGKQGAPLQPLLAAQAGLVLLALLCSILPRAIAWSARRHDIRRGPQVASGSDL